MPGYKRVVDGRCAADRNTRPSPVHGLIDAGAVELWKRACGENVGIDRPRATEHESGNRRTGEKTLSVDLPG